MGGKRKQAEADGPAEIDQLACSSSGRGPFAVYFPSGYDPNAEGAAPAWTAYEHTRGRNHYTLVAETGDGKVDFVGSTSSVEYTAPAACRYALGVFDHSTGRLEVMPLEGGRVLRMEPRVWGQRYEPRKEASAIEAEMRREHNKRLVEEFGSQRRKRQLMQAEAGQVKVDQVSGANALLDMVTAAGEGAARKEDVVAAALAQRNIPPHHPEATTPEEAYRSDELVPPMVADALEVRKLFPATNKPDYREQLRSSGQFGAGYILSRLELLGQREEAVREERARFLVLLGHLLKLYMRFGTLRGRGTEELARKAQMDQNVLEPLLELFYTREDTNDGNDRYSLSKERRSLMLAWILALAVRVEERSVLEPSHFLALAEELKMRSNDVVARFRELGCSDSGTTALNPEGARVRSYRVVLLPHSASEQKRLADYFPALKLGGKKPGGK